MSAAIRYQMAYMGEDYEMIEYEVGDPPNYDRSTWLDVKSTLGFAFPNLPYLIDLDYKLTETTAIHKYLAEKFCPNLLGNNIEHRGEVNMLESIICGNGLNGMIRNACYSNEKEKAIKAIEDNVPIIAEFIG